MTGGFESLWEARTSLPNVLAEWTFIDIPESDDKAGVSSTQSINNKEWALCNCGVLNTSYDL